MLNTPSSVSVSTDDTLYIADKSNNRIRAISPTGIITTVAGNGLAGYYGDNGQATLAKLNNPTGVFKSSDALYIADFNNYRIRKVLSNGVIITVAGTNIAGFTMSNGPATSVSLGNPQSVFVTQDNSIYIVAAPNNIRRISPDGIMSIIVNQKATAGYYGDGGAATSAFLNNPNGIYVTSDNTIYVADSNNNRIRVVSPTGIISTFAGTGAPGYSTTNNQATSTNLYNPQGVFVTSDNTVYIADTNNHRIRKVYRESI
jgi:hypothetical protein